MPLFLSFIFIYLKEVFLMSMINKEVSDFKVQAYQNGEFRTVTKADILGK